ncbi:phospholipid-transporting ATPase IA isoform X6 [Bicyclus anynana]|uniref:Phospholipid-transporting ATPase n=1 Tax=Bicyclus anynana TaxID=110368 RepID=A0ABM3LGT8_BICAN|nr:phospholipid-transporting ATPase IA isoform X6 [Bicyclus anynana]
MLAVCHTVIPELVDGAINYHAASPGNDCLPPTLTVPHMLAVCHTVIPELVDGAINYHAASPGNDCLPLTLTVPHMLAVCHTVIPELVDGAINYHAASPGNDCLPPTLTVPHMLAVCHTVIPELVDGAINYHAASPGNDCLPPTLTVPHMLAVCHTVIPELVDGAINYHAASPGNDCLPPTLTVPHMLAVCHTVIPELVDGAINYHAASPGNDCLPPTLTVPHMLAVCHTVIPELVDGAINYHAASPGNDCLPLTLTVPHMLAVCHTVIPELVDGAINYHAASPGNDCLPPTLTVPHMLAVCHTVIPELVDGAINYHAASPGNDCLPPTLTVPHMLAVCHTVIPELVDGAINYHAASPDERALVAGAAAWGWVFAARTPQAVTVRARGRTLTYSVLHVLAFTSSRKRMSVVVRAPTGEIKLYCKGADSVIYPRLAGGPRAAAFAEATLAHLEHFADEGLRTLVFAVADIPEHFYKDWSNTYHKASIAIHDREQKLEEAALLIENNLRLLGATAIEDKLQDGVPEAVAALLQANIHVWVLTGDKQETAINIAHSARLLHAAMPLLVLNEDSLDATRESLSRHLADFGENLCKENEVALVIDGQTLKYAMGCDLKKDFLDLCVSCKVVVCCRVSPIQKAEVVEMVSRATGAVTLAIGDGANDVAMIQRASVGVGISGVEGLQAVCASDYSIAQFRFLVRLLLVHGAWNYSRISKLILYSFYKNICLYVIELWFAIYSAWSGQILFERWTIGFYNVIFTALPPFAIGLFDKICSPEIMLRHPVLYIPSQQNLLFNVRVFWVWAVNALLHSMLLFWLPVLLTQHHVLWPHGKDGGYLVLGNFVYTFVVATVCLKAGLATHSWTWVTHVSIWGSIALWFLFILVYSNLYPTILIGAVMRGMDRMVFSSLVFWFGLLLVPAATLLPDLVVTVIHNSAFKTMTEAVRESEIKKRDPAALLAQPRHSVFPSWTYLKCYVRGITTFMCATDARHAVARLAQSSRRRRACCRTCAACSGAAPPPGSTWSSSCRMGSRSRKRRAPACRRPTSSARTTRAGRAAPERARVCPRAARARLACGRCHATQLTAPLQRKIGLLTLQTEKLHELLKRSFISFYL